MAKPRPIFVLLILGVSFFLHFQVNARSKNLNTAVEQLRRDLPVFLCASEGYFQKCYTLQKNECWKMMSQFSNLCISKMSSQAAAQPKYGGEVGACVGREFLKAGKIKNKNQECLAGAALF